MSSEKGIVKRIENGFAWVELIRQTACNSCSGYMLSGNNAQHQRNTVKAINTINANVGQAVIVNINDQLMLKGIFSMFILPLFPILVGLVSGSWVAETFNIDGQTAVIVSIVTGILLGVLLMWMAARRLNNNQETLPDVVRIIRTTSNIKINHSIHQNNNLGCSMCR